VKRVIALLTAATFSSFAIAQKPDARWLQQMVYDDENKGILMYGGATENKTFTDTWLLKDSGWTRLSDQGPAVIKCAFAYDAGRKRVVLFGGSGDNRSLDETWEWNGNKWEQIAVPAPPARNHPMAAYDRKNKVILMFGGFGAHGALSDTWTYDGRSWKQTDSSGPKNCLPHGMVYDEKLQAVILVTVPLSAPGESYAKNEMWKWTGSSWRKLSYNGPLTSANSLQALGAFGDDGIVLFDGDDVSNGNGKTWMFSEQHWSSESLTGPSPRVGHSIVYDKSKNKTLLFGGTDRKRSFNDLWEWNGKVWRQISN
jgi:hypothetical protein